MTKKEIKQVVKEHGYTMITPSFYTGKYGIICNLYNRYGEVYKLYVAHHKGFATLQPLSDVAVHDDWSVKDWFN